jgi:hypothetical protein
MLVNKMGAGCAAVLASGFYGAACLAALAGNLVLAVAYVVVAAVCLVVRRWLA